MTVKKLWNYIKQFHIIIIINIANVADYYNIYLYRKWFLLYSATKHEIVIASSLIKITLINI